MCMRVLEKNHVRKPAKSKAQWSEQSFHVANRHMQMLYLRVTPPSLSTTSLYSPSLFFYVSATVLSRVIFILLLPQSLRGKNIIAKLSCKVILNFAINNLINWVIIYSHI